MEAEVPNDSGSDDGGRDGGRDGANDSGSDDGCRDGGGSDGETMLPLSSCGDMFEVNSGRGGLYEVPGRGEVGLVKSGEWNEGEDIQKLKMLFISSSVIENDGAPTYKSGWLC